MHAKLMSLEAIHIQQQHHKRCTKNDAPSQGATSLGPFISLEHNIGSLIVLYILDVIVSPPHGIQICYVILSSNYDHLLSQETCVHATQLLICIATYTCIVGQAKYDSNVARQHRRESSLLAQAPLLVDFMMIT